VLPQLLFDRKRVSSQARGRGAPGPPINPMDSQDLLFFLGEVNTNISQQGIDVILPEEIHKKTGSGEADSKSHQ